MKAVDVRKSTISWSAGQAEEERFRKIVLISLIIAFLFSLAMYFIKLPEKPRLDAEKVPPRLAKMLVEKKPEPPPKPELPKPPEPEKPKVEEKKPEPKPKDKKEEARKKAANAGVMAMKDMLADLREAQPVEALKTKDLQTAGANESAKSRSVLMAKAGKGSGGIDTSRFSRTASDNEIGGRDVTAVTSDIEAAGYGVVGGEETEVEGRSLDEITKVMLANYTPIFSVYQRELRTNPSLRGKVVFRMTILPDGTVTECTVLDSELGNADLERKLALRIKRINFGAKDVETVVVDFPIDFLPPN